VNGDDWFNWQKSSNSPQPNRIVRTAFGYALRSAMAVRMALASFQARRRPLETGAAPSRRTHASTAFK
jgi:hypothetical protein